MQVICQLSGYAYHIQGFNSNKLSTQEKPFSHIHPIMLANTKQLASIMPSNKQEQALYVLATCYAFNDLISYNSISPQGFKALCEYQGLTQLANTILDSLTMFDSATVQLPTFSLTDESVTNILDYIETCKCELALANNKAEQRKLAALAAKEAHKHKVLARATTMYPVKFANWILEQLPEADIAISSGKQLAGMQPKDTLANYWKRILTSLIKDPANYWSFDSRYVADLFNEIEDYITSDSVQGLEVYKLMDRVRAEASLFGASILGEPSSKYKASQPAKSISLGTVLAESKSIDKPAADCISDAPASKPCKTQYSSHTQYLIALAKWRAVTGSALGSPSNQYSV